MLWRAPAAVVSTLSVSSPLRVYYGCCTVRTGRACPGSLVSLRWPSIWLTHIVGTWVGQTVDCRTAFLDCTSQTQISEDLRGELETITFLHWFKELLSALGCLPIHSLIFSPAALFNPGSSLSPVCLFRQPHSLCSSREFLVEFIHLFFSVSWNYFYISYMSMSI